MRIPTKPTWNSTDYKFSILALFHSLSPSRYPTLSLAHTHSVSLAPMQNRSSFCFFLLAIPTRRTPSQNVWPQAVDRQWWTAAVRGRQRHIHNQQHWNYLLKTGSFNIQQFVHALLRRSLGFNDQTAAVGPLDLIKKDGWLVGSLYTTALGWEEFPPLQNYTNNFSWRRWPLRVSRFTWSGRLALARYSAALSPPRNTDVEMAHATIPERTTRKV